MSTTTASTGAAKKSNEKQQQEIIAHFQKLRDEQRIIASKAAELQIEQKSHEFVYFKNIKYYPELRSNFFLWILRLVIETLKEVEKDRKCFRMIGGVLVERTVNEVLPALETNKDQVWPFYKSCFRVLKIISI